MKRGSINEKKQHKKYPCKCGSSKRTEQYTAWRDQRSESVAHDICGGSGSGAGSENMQSILGDEKAQQDTIKGLQSAEGFIRRELARTINMRNTPEIKFIVDQSIEYGVNISKKIDEVTKDLKDEAGDIDE